MSATSFLLNPKEQAPEQVLIAHKALLVPIVWVFPGTRAQVRKLPWNIRVGPALPVYPVFPSLVSSPSLRNMTSVFQQIYQRVIRLLRTAWPASSPELSCHDGDSPPWTSTSAPPAHQFFDLEDKDGRAGDLLHEVWVTWRAMLFQLKLGYSPMLAPCKDLRQDLCM